MPLSIDRCTLTVGARVGSEVIKTRLVGQGANSRTHRSEPGLLILWGANIPDLNERNGLSCGTDLNRSRSLLEALDEDAWLRLAKGLQAGPRGTSFRVVVDRCPELRFARPSPFHDHAVIVLTSPPFEAQES